MINTGKRFPMIAASVVASQFVDHDVSDATRRRHAEESVASFMINSGRSFPGQSTVSRTANQMTVRPIGI
jgi:hypothetical protein